jgi:hypothetical protein
MPALPLHEAGKYVAGAYIVFAALIVIYVAIMSTRLSRIERELGELLGLAERRRERERDGERERERVGPPPLGADAPAPDEPVGAQRP